MQWDRTHRRTTILIIHQSHGEPKWTSTHGANDQKQLLLWHQNKYRPPSAHNSTTRNTQGWQVTFTALLCVSHSDWLLWEGPWLLSQPDCTWAVTGAMRLGCGLGLQPNTIFQKPHSHPATQPCGELWTSLPSLENNNPLPLAPLLCQQTAPPGCLAREHSRGSPEELLHMHI